jgi:hypothetical protein
MKFAAVVLLALLLAGCFPVAPHIYAPSDRSFEAIDWKMCEPTYRAVLLKRPDLTVDFEFRPRGDGLFGIFELVSPKGLLPRFTSNQVAVIADGEAQPVAVLEEYPERLTADGTGETKSYSIAVPLPSEQSELSITLPPTVVGTHSYASTNVAFRRRVQPMLMGLCQ